MKTKPIAPESDDVNIWVIPNQTPAQPECVSIADWNKRLPDGMLLTDPAHSVLLSELQGFLRTALEDPREGIRMAPGSVAVTLDALVELASFLVRTGRSSLSEMTSAASWEYVDYIEDEYVEDQGTVGRPRELTYSSASRLLRPLAQIYAQREAMSELSLFTMPEPPFDGMAVYAVVTEVLGLGEPGKLLPIPDEVAVPTLARAHRWVTIGGADVVELQAAVLGCYGSLPRHEADAQARKVIEAFRFSVDPQTCLPWHPPIRRRARTMIDGRETQLSLFQALRRIILEMQAACAICVQGGTGIRAHELLGLRSGRGEAATEPRIVSKRVSSDGLMENYFVAGVTAKGDATDVEWLLGMRPLGTAWEPIPAKALDLLETLMEPWRSLGGHETLLVSFSAARGLPRSKGSVGKVLACSLTYMQKEFALHACVEDGMPEEQALIAARKVRGHCWRPTFAHFVFRTSSSLLMPLRDHYKHVSDAVTEQGYIGNDASLLEDLENERVQETARLLLEISHGKPAGAGTVQHLAMKYQEKLAEEINAMVGDTLEEKALLFVQKNEIRIWNGTYATCFMDILPTQSKCNDMASIPGFARVRPDFAQRSPAVCAACACCWIRPEHRGFWTRRLEENEAIVEIEQQTSVFAGGSVAAGRVKQSKAILSALDRRSDSSSAFGLA